MADILKVPSTFTYSASTTQTSYLYGGNLSSCLIELPDRYIIGGYEYTKNLVATDTNGFWDLVADYTNGIPHSSVWDLNNTYAYRNSGLLNPGLLGYYGGLGLATAIDTVNSANSSKHGRIPFIKPRAACGTVGRRVRPMSYIRDLKDKNIIYLTVAGPQLMSNSGVMKLDTKLRTTVWRSFCNGTGTDTYVSSNNSSVAEALSYTGHQLEYLYQTSTSLYFAVPRTSKGCADTRYKDYTPTDVTIMAVDKSSGTFTEATYFNLYTLGLSDTMYGHLECNLVDITNTYALFDVQQTNIAWTYNQSGVIDKNFTKADQALNIRALVRFEFASNEASVLWSNNKLHVPTMYAKAGVISSIGSGFAEVREGLYKLTGSLVIPELNNTVFIPHDVIGTSHGYRDKATSIGLASCELMYQLRLNKEGTEVVDSKQLPVFNSSLCPQKFIPFAPYFVAGPVTADMVNQAQFSGLHPNTTYTQAYIIGYSEFGAGTYSYSYYGYPYNGMYSLEAFAYSQPFMVLAQTWMEEHTQNPQSYSFGYMPISASYDYIKTERKDPILRVQELKTESAPRKTLMPKGEDIVAPGCAMYTCSYSTNFLTGSTMYRSYLACAAPWGVTISCKGFRSVGSTGVGYANNFHGLGITPHNIGSWYDTFSGVSYNKQYANEYEMIFKRISYIGTLPDCSYLLRRSHTDLKRCGIYLNNKAFPIKAVSYSINPMPELPNGAPTSWVLEAHDVKTGNWIEVDKQENITLTVPVFSTTQYDGINARMLSARWAWGAETRQFRNYFHLKDMDTKCPDGAHAFKITFKDSRDGKNIAIRSFMIQEEPWPWEPVTIPYCYGNASLSNTKTPTTGNTQILSYICSASGSSTSSYFSNMSPSLYNGILPLPCSIIGPRVPSTTGCIYQTSSYTPLYYTTSYYDSGRFANTSNINYGYNFGAGKVEIQGIQFSMLGCRENTTSAPAAAIPSALVFQGSNNASEWQTLAKIDNPDLMPGLPIDPNQEDATDPNAIFWTKTFLFELDAPVSYQFYRVAWDNGSKNIGSPNSSSSNYWYIQNLSFFRKREGTDYKDMLPMQSFLGGCTCQSDAWGTGGYIKDSTATRGTKWASSWSPWIAEKDATTTAYSTFDTTCSLNTGYYNPSGGMTPSLWSKAVSDDKPSVTLAQWGALLTKEAAVGSLYQPGNYVKVGATIDNLPITEEARPWNPAHMDKVKIVRYAFVYTSVTGVPLNNRPKRWKLFGSQDKTEWTVLDERMKDDWKSTDAYTGFKVTNPDWYTFYKLEIYEDIGKTSSGIIMSSVDTFIEIPGEDSPHLHTIRPRNMLHWVPTDGTDDSHGQYLPQSHIDQYAQKLEVVKGSTIQNNPNDLVRELGMCSPVSFSYEDQESIEMDIDQGCKLQTNSLFIRLSPSMEDDELPKKITIKGSNDKSAWTVLADSKAVTWNLDENNPYKGRIEFDTSGVYRYIKAIFHKPGLASDHKFVEHWLHRTHCSNMFDLLLADSAATNKVTPQITYKVKPDKYFVQCGYYFERPTANLWINDDTFAQVYPFGIGIMKLDPITQSVKQIRRITPTGTGYLLGAILDSSKNLWYWTNTIYGTSNTSNNTNHFVILAVQSSYSPNTVRVKFESPTAIYDGTPLTKKVSVWIEDPTVAGDNKKVAGKVKITLSGGGAKFVSNTEDTITVETEDGQAKELEFTASGPARVTAQAVMVR